MQPSGTLIKYGRISIYLNMFGIVFSGLIFPVLSQLFAPQPMWKDAQLFIANFHPLQTVTFFFGFFLVIGSLMTFIVLTLLSIREKSFYALTGLSINILFTAVVFLNYIIQTTYIPYLASNNPPEASLILPAFTMANPGSFAWALELYGWGGIGLSFLFMSKIFGEVKHEKILKILFIINGSCSIITALVTSIDMNWIFSIYGFMSLIVWNVLVFIIDIFLLQYLKNVEKQGI